MRPADLLIDPDSLTIGELAVFEEFTGFTIEETLDAISRHFWVESATFLVACVFVVQSRTFPGYTIEEASSVVFADFGQDDLDGE